MAESDAAAPPPEVVAPVEEQTAPAVGASTLEEAEPAAAAAPAAEGEGEHKRKLEEVDAAPDANGGGEDAKRPRVEGDGEGVVQSNESSAKVDEPVATENSDAAPAEASVDAVNGKVPPTEDSQMGSGEKPAAEAAVTEAPPQEGGGAPGQETSRIINVPNNKVGVLIGKSGETIRNLQMNSGAKIQITKDAEADANAPTRSVELVGTLESIDKAERLIKNVIAEADAGGSPALIARGFGSGQSGSEQFEMLVPDNKVGLIIGKGGETIKTLQTRSGARIQLIPQHPPEGVTLTERTVRITGNKKQIEAAKDMIKQAMSQTFSRHGAQSGGYGQQNYRPQGHGAASQWGPRSQPQPGYGYPPRGPPPQNMPYSQPYGGYPQQPPPRGGMGWDQRQGPPPHASHHGGGYDYYKQGSQPYEGQPPNYPPGPGNYNSYGPSQGPNYGQPQYPQSAPPQNYGPGYGDPRYNAPAPNQQYYGQPPAGPQQGYPPQQDPYARPYGGPGQWAPRGAPAGDGTYQAPPPTSYGPPSQQPPAYGQTYGPTTGPDGYSQQSYPQQGAQAPATYGQSAPAGPGYAQQGAQQGGYAQYPQSQPAYGDQAAQNNANYGYQGAPADPNYGNAYPQAGYGSTPASGQAGYAAAPAAGQPGYGQPGYTQPPTNPPAYDQSAQPPAQSGYAAPPANPPQPAVAKGVSPQPAGYGGQWTA
uniref:K Homology domain-containing protein n=1 Tax=Oryza nivara TaxID=4536 RepID=A0A0E0I6H7_ORYNI